jgi:hypothetical protein
MIQIFLTERSIDGHLYGEQICAHNFEEANEIAAKIGAKVLGTLEEVRCGNCNSVVHGTKDLLAPDEWPDEIG